MLISLLFLAGLAQSPGPAPERLMPPAAAAGMTTPEGRRIARAGFVEGLERSEGAEVIAAIRRNYPEDYEPLVDRLLDAAIAHADDRNAAMDAAFHMIADYVDTKNPDLLNAPAASLIALNARTVAFFRAAMTSDVGFCAHFTISGLENPQQLPASLRAPMGAISLAMIEAAGAGHRAAPISGRGTLVPRHAEAWLRQIQSLDTDGQIMPLIEDEAAMARAAPQAQCRVGLAMFEAIGRLPPAAAASMLAYLLGQAAHPARP